MINNQIITNDQTSITKYSLPRSGPSPQKSQAPTDTFHYWSYFVDPDPGIKTWQRIVAGATLPILGPLSLAGCYGVEEVRSPREPVTTISDNVVYTEKPSLVGNAEGYGASWVGLDESKRRQIYYSRINRQGIKEGENVRITSYLNGGNFSSPFLVWNNSYGEYGLFWVDSRDFYFHRIDEDGNNLGSVIGIAQNISSATPSSAWNDSDLQYGVVWSGENRLGKYPFGIRYLCMDDVGNIQGGMDFGEDGAVGETYLSTDWNGESFGVVWTGAGGSPREIRFTQIDGGCNKTGEVKTIATGEISALRMFWAGDHYGLTWFNDREGSIQFTKLDRNGNTITGDVLITRVATPIVVGDLYLRGDYSAIWSQQGYGIVWTDERTHNIEERSNYQSIKLAGLASDGDLVGDPEEIIGHIRSNYHSPPISYYPSLTWWGDGFGIAWQYLSDQQESAELHFELRVFNWNR